MPDEPRSQTVTVALSRTEAMALHKVAESGLVVVKGLGLIQHPATAESAIDKLALAIRFPARASPAQAETPASSRTASRRSAGRASGRTAPPP